MGADPVTQKMDEIVNGVAADTKVDKAEVEKVLCHLGLEAVLKKVDKAHPEEFSRLGVASAKMGLKHAMGHDV